MSDDVTSTIEPVGTTMVKSSGVAVSMVREYVAVDALNDQMTQVQRENAVRNILKEAPRVEDRLQLAKGELLYETMSNGYWKNWGYDTPDGVYVPYTNFGMYVEQELGISERRAYDLVAIYKKLVLALNLPTDILKTLEWSKVAQVISYINSDNVYQVLDALKGLTWQQAVAYAKKLKSSIRVPKSRTLLEGETSIPEPTVGLDDIIPELPKHKKINFKVTPEQYDSIQVAMAAAADLTKSSDEGTLLEMICNEFLLNNVDTSTGARLNKLELLKATIEKVYHCELEVKNIDGEFWASEPGSVEAAR